MKRLILVLSLVLPILLGSVSFHSIQGQESNPISISYPNLTQNIKSVPMTFQDPEFKFSIHNIAKYPVIVKAFGEILHAEDQADQFIIDWVANNIELAPDELFDFQPIVTINTDIGYEYAVHFVFEAWTVTNTNEGNKLVGGVGGTAKFIVFTEQEGARLQIRTTDQNDVERLADIRIYYGGLDAQGWSIQKSLSDSYYTDIVKQGYYWVIATDKDFGLETQAKPFPVFNDTQIDLVFDLLSFPEISILAPEKRNNGIMIVNSTLTNYYPSLSNVYYQIRLEKENETLRLFENDFARLQQGIHRDYFKWNLSTWENTVYTVTATIWVDGKLYHNQSQTIEMNFPYKIELNIPNINLENIGYGLGLIIFGGFSQWVIFRVVKRKKLPQESNINEIQT